MPRMDQHVPPLAASLRAAYLRDESEALAELAAQARLADERGERFGFIAEIGGAKALARRRDGLVHGRKKRRCGDRPVASKPPLSRGQWSDPLAPTP